ncbi:hypothetical protein [Streptomyces sp. NPDC014793]|uniref:hypothetical protein n=1 Tax=Streptomyces sp. NPDC014793 TaxID=3364914 RepID=UPI00370081BA
MRSATRAIFKGLAALPLALTLLSCGRAEDSAIPETLCGTSIDPALVRPLLVSTEGLHEINRVERTNPVFAPCVLVAGHDPVVELQFSWDGSPPDLTYLAQGTGSVSHVSQPRKIDLAEKAISGTDGAIAIARCKTKGGNYFTLTLQLPQVKLTDQSHRADIEKFMRAYFPATVKTLGCA